MKKSNRLITTFLCLVLLGFQNILAQPLFTTVRSSTMVPVSREIAFDAKQTSNSELLAKMEVEYPMPSPEQLELITSVYREYEIPLEDWMSEPQTKGWQSATEENVEMECWMYRPANWLQ